MSEGKAKPEWWREFFSGLAVEFWQAALPEEATRADVAFLWDRLRLFDDARVLDVCCGAGRLMLPLAERGCSVSGLDISEEFLHAAGRVGAERGLPLDLRQGDMRSLPWVDRFDGVFCFGNSFGYLDDEGHAAFFQSVARALKPGGRFAFDYGQAAESILPRLVPHEEAHVGDFRFIEDNRYDPREGRVETRYTIVRGDRTEIPPRLYRQRAHPDAGPRRALHGRASRIPRGRALRHRVPAPHPRCGDALRLFTTDQRLIRVQLPSRTVSPRFSAFTAKYVRIAAPTRFSRR
jgi:SAM-dependent methyltransferase